MNENLVTSAANSALSAVDAVLYYFKSAVSALTSNKTILLASVFLLLTMGKSVSLGKNVKYKGWRGRWTKWPNR